jgi:putative oxidoreductase
MRIVSTIARLLLGVIFTVFGLNGFLNFLSMGPVPPLAGQFLGALVQSHYMSVVFFLQLACGVLLIANRFVPLALTVLGAVIVNILLVHVFMAPAGLPLAILVAVLWSISAYRVRYAFSGLFERSVRSESTSPNRRPGTAIVHA